MQTKRWSRILGRAAKGANTAQMVPDLKEVLFGFEPRVVTFDYPHFEEGFFVVPSEKMDFVGLERRLGENVDFVSSSKGGCTDLYFDLGDRSSVQSIRLRRYERSDLAHCLDLIVSVPGDALHQEHVVVGQFAFQEQKEAFDRYSDLVAFLCESAQIAPLFFGEKRRAKFYYKRPEVRNGRYGGAAFASFSIDEVIGIQCARTQEVVAVKDCLPSPYIFEMEASTDLWPTPKYQELRAAAYHSFVGEYGRLIPKGDRKFFQIARTIPSALKSAKTE